MGEKLDINRSYGQKLVSLFVQLLFSGESYSLTELARKLSCSKQTVLRLINDIDMSYNAEVDQFKVGNRSYYRIIRPSRVPLASISETEFLVLEMCRDFTAQFLGKKLFMEATNTLMKSQVLASGGNKRGGMSPYFSNFCPGTIDYTPHSETIHTLIKAMKKKQVCTITYQAIMDEKPKTHTILPLKLFSYKDTIYLHARIYIGTGRKRNNMLYDPLLAVHRMKKVNMTDNVYEMPADYDFEKIFNKNFGVIKGKPFKVTAEFTGWAARYVVERIWSSDQKIIKKGKNKIVLEFTASSESEVISWILSFGEEAKVLKPEGLVKEMKLKSNRLAHPYCI